MADAIMVGERFASYKIPAWHKKGKVFDEALTATQAVNLANIDFNVFKSPVYTSITDEFGDEVKIATDKYVVMREPVDEDPQYRVLSKQWVGENYTIIPTGELASMLQPLTDGSLKKTFAVETVGALGNGETVFFVLKAGDIQIANEHHEAYYLVSDHRDGTGSLNVAFTPVRVVCMNTLIAGLDSAQVKISLKHDANVRHDTEWYMGLFQQMLMSQNSVIEQMDSLSKVSINNDEVKQIINSAYRGASRPRRLKIMQSFASSISETDLANKNTTLALLSNSERSSLEEEFQRRVDTVEYHRRSAMEVYHAYNDEYPKIAGTAWAAWQAITEYEDHRRGHDDSTMSPIFGERAAAKARAFQAAYKIAVGK